MQRCIQSYWLRLLSVVSIATTPGIPVDAIRLEMFYSPAGVDWLCFWSADCHTCSCLCCSTATFYCYWRRSALSLSFSALYCTLCSVNASLPTADSLRLIIKTACAHLLCLAITCRRSASSRAK